MATVIQVQKRDGRLEDWDRGKVLNGVVKSGLSSEEAGGVGALIEGWAVRNAQNDVVKSEDVRNKVLEILRAVYPGAASNFEAYKRS